jgi:hypothetical protein
MSCKLTELINSGFSVITQRAEDKNIRNLDYHFLVLMACGGSDLSYRTLLYVTMWANSFCVPIYLSHLAPLLRLSKWPDWTNYSAVSSPIIGFVRSLGSDTTRRNEKRESKKRNKNVAACCAYGHSIEQTHSCSGVAQCWENSGTKYLSCLVVCSAVLSNQRYVNLRLRTDLIHLVPLRDTTNHFFIKNYIFSVIQLHKRLIRWRLRIASCSGCEIL